MHCEVVRWSRPVDVASVDGVTADRAAQSTWCIGDIRRVSPWCEIARGASGVLVAQTSGCTSCRRAVVACRSSVEETWWPEVVWFLVLLFVQRLW